MFINLTTIVALLASASAVIAAPAPAQADSDIAARDTQSTWLTMHNNYRAQHGAKALTWNSTLASYAQTYANKCVFKHSGGKYGENLAAGVGYDDAALFKGWTDESSAYSSSNPTASHFTQVVWKSSTQLGCYKASCADGTIFTGYGTSDYVVCECEYSPAGNVIGQFAANVQK
ncbi:hypothetical protein I350_02401 [Cryptococcus amylolentus CBS 6273]|uniref:SCP domain-containing protein n=1 Tax=Cryptococcus amylolentus CBS 6273 TaxID=1296118 RepID=A0A1E3KD10_9TREE|nr:hypothetical protein I350_02401 [Cryptococcus amylolentus CBS 6273]